MRGIIYGMNKIKSLFIILCILPVILISCTVQQDISITVNGSGSSDLLVKLEPVFVYYILDLAEAFSDSDDTGKVDIFKLEEIKKQINERPGASVEKIVSPDQKTLELSFQFSDIRKLLTSGDKNVQDIITFSSKKGINTIHFHLEKSNYSSLTDLFPMLKNQVFENLAPQVDEDIPAAEYLDIIEFAMGEDGPGAVKSSDITIKVNVQGKIVSQKGGTVKNNTVLFQIPLLRVCLLNQPLDFEITYTH
jgi:hypothetical protein